MDTANLRHVLFDRPHGVTPSLVTDVARLDPVLVGNSPGQGRSGSHKMIGPNVDGRFWTIILLHRYEDLCDRSQAGQALYRKSACTEVHRDDITEPR